MINVDVVYNAFRNAVRDAIKAQSLDVDFVKAAHSQSLSLGDDNMIIRDTVEMDLDDFNFEENEEFNGRSNEQNADVPPTGEASGAFEAVLYSRKENTIQSLTAVIVGVIREFKHQEFPTYIKVESITRPEADLQGEVSPFSRVIRVGVTIRTDSQWR